MYSLTKNFEAEIRALSADGGDDARRALVCALADDRPAVARAARMALAERFVVHRDWLLQVYKTARRGHTRTQVLALLARGGRADSMVSLLEAVAAVDYPRSRKQACRHLEDWLAQWAPLSPRDTCRLAAAVLDAEHVLPVFLAERLWEYLRGQRRLPRTVRLPRVPLRGVPMAPALPEKRVEAVVRTPLEYFDGRVRHRSYELAPTWWGWCRGVLRV